MSDAILVALILLPLFLSYFLKSSASLGFLALCGGYVLQSFAGDDVKSLFSKTNISLSGNVINVLLIAIPPIVTLLLCRGTSSRNLSNPKVLLNASVAIGLGGTFILMSASLIGAVSGNYLTDVSLYKTIAKAHSEIIGISAVLALVLIWLGYRKGSGHDKHKK